MKKDIEVEDSIEKYMAKPFMKQERIKLQMYIFMSLLNTWEMKYSMLNTRIISDSM